MFGFLKKIFGTAQDRKVRQFRKTVAKVNEWEEKFQGLSDQQLRAKTDEFRKRFAEGESLDSMLPEAYAVVKNVCKRLKGTQVHVSGYDQQWDMVPYDVQIIGAIALHNGCISEMQTGEGKTLTAVMPLYLNALSGKPVHLVTVNDYLAERDCQWVGSVLRWLGLTTGALTNYSPPEERKALYERDVIYGTASEFGFDYLRDNSMASYKEQQVQRGHYFAIIDEVDSILIDEARTPLIISGPVPQSRQMYDELKGGAAALVRLQRDYCNGIANESRRVLENNNSTAEEKKEALRKLWLVGKGTPQNKVLRRVKEDPDLRAELDKWDLYYYNDQLKDERAQALAQLYMIVDEKGNEYELTDKGIQAWVDHSGIGKADDFTMLDLSHEFLEIDENNSLSEDQKIQLRLQVQEEDALRKERAHNLRQLLRGHLLMERDVDYIIQDNKIVIIDENTGRPQPGRRFSDGLHQAIEAKEGVEIQKETQTYATITLQNYFRMYDKLAGMTGTAATEANEFKQIYKLEVLEIPTHRECKRTDENDEIYMTEREKYNAILAEVRKIHEQGRPTLLGTESVEISEKLSRIFRQAGLPHTVLNAKHHAQEADIIAHAGRRGAITIATNMAGRGTDIKLDPGVAELGGLYVLGTTRHQSRRIDRQLRGRCARQGDPGSSKFYISFEDSILRLFASPRLTAIIQRFRPDEGEPISAPILNRSVETAQKRIEQRNYNARKHTLEYDDVMNKQRQEIYAFRNELLTTDNVVPLAHEVIETVCLNGAEEFLQSRGTDGGWNPEGYREWLINRFPVSFPEGVFDDDHLDFNEIVEKATHLVRAAFDEKIRRENSKFAQTESVRTPTNEAIRNLMIRKIDQKWQQHLLGMDHLRSDVNLRSVGQRDPLTEFKHEAFRLFDEFSRNIRSEIAHALFRFEMIPQNAPSIQDLLKTISLETNRSFTNELEGNEPPKEPAEPPKPRPIVVEDKSGRNEICPCGSGKKYKKCCGIYADDEAHTQR